MSTVKRKEIRSTLKALLTEAVASLEQTPPSKKTIKLVKKLSSLLSGQVKKDIKKQSKKAGQAKKEKAPKAPKAPKASKKNKKSAPRTEEKAG